MSDEGPLYYRIGEVARLVGVDTHVLRYWETEFGIQPHRSSSGQRLYRKEELDTLLRIRSLLHDEGYTIAGARKALDGGEATATVPPDLLAQALDRLRAARAAIAQMRAELRDPAE